MRRPAGWGRAARPARDISSAEAFAEWLAEARMGEWIRYHVGPGVCDIAGRKAPAAISAADARDAGFVTLALRRVRAGEGAGGFEFLARRVVREAGA